MTILDLPHISDIGSLGSTDYVSVRHAQADGSYTTAWAGMSDLDLAVNRPVGVCKYGAIQSRVPFWSGVDSVISNYTICEMVTAETDYDFVRVLFSNNNPGGASAITAVSVASTAGIGDSVNPIDSTGVINNTLWVPSYFNNGGAGGFPPIIPSSGTTRAFSVPAGTQNAFTSSGSSNPADVAASIVASDWALCPSIPQLDGSLPKLHVRVAAGTNFSSSLLGGPLGNGINGQYGGSAWDAYANGRIVRTNLYQGDKATAPGTLTPAADQWAACLGVQFLSRKRGLSVLSVGDSEFAGAGTVTAQNNPFHMACTALSTPSVPVIHHNAAVSGQSAETYTTNLMSILKIYRPEVVILKGYSPNDGYTAAQFPVALARVLAQAAMLADNDIIPVLATAEPFAGYTGAAEIARLAYNAAIRSSGYLFVDMDVALSNGGSPAVTLPGYLVGTINPNHYNDAGSAAIAPYVITVLKKIINNRPR